MKPYSPLHKKALFLFGMLALSLTGSAQNPSLKVFEDWRTQAGSQNSFYRAATINVPGTMNSIVCGATINTNGDYDVFVQKLDGSGSTAWSYQYDGPGNGDDVATDVCFDPSSGYTYVVGSYFESSGDSLNAIIIALDPSGIIDWNKTHNGSGSGADGFLDVEIDPNTGDIYCAGSEWKGIGSGMYDVLIAKYNAAGAQIWTNTYDYMAMIDGGYKLALTAKPSVTCALQDAPTDFQLGVLIFDPSSGSFGSSTISGGTMMGYDRASDVVFDDTGNVYLVGSVYNSLTWSDIRVTKYDTMLNVVWEYDIDAGYNMDDYAAGIALDSHNNVIVVGTSRTFGSGLNYTVVKYNNAGGLRFFYSYNGQANGDDSAAAVVISPNDTNGIYITGYSYNGSTNDYWTMRLDGMGNSLWDIEMNSFLNGDDRATAIALDTVGDVVVTGQTKLDGAIYAYTTTRYIQKNVLLADDTIAHISNSFIYTENRDQIWGTDDATHPEIKYYVINSMPKIYFMDTAVSYVFASVDTTTIATPVDTFARVDMKFVGANNNLRVRPMDKRDDYDNFFLGHIPEGRSNVPNYDQLIYPQVWNNVDLVFGSNSAGMKYYFICKPGGGGSSVSQIDLYYDGADSVKIGAGGELIIYTPLGNVVQPKAAAWQLDATGAFQSLGWQPTYAIIGTNEVSFSGFGSYNPSQPLVLGIDWGVINPTSNQDNLWWSTFYGGGNHDKFKDVKVSLTGKQVTGGNTNSASFPVLNGVQMFNNGAANIGILVQFRADNSREWATYYGGANTPASYLATSIEGLDIDPIGDVYITGITNSSDLPRQPWGAAYYQNNLNNGCTTCHTPDAFIAKISENGMTLIWSTYWGGDSSDLAYDLHISALDPNDFYIGGSTMSTNCPFPNTLPAWANGTGFFVRFDYLGDDLYGSYIGNPGSGCVYAIAVDQNLDVVLCGEVGTGTALPVLLPTTGNTGDATFNSGTGSRDAFMTKLDFTTSTPAIEWSMYYGGTSMSEAVRDIVTNPGGSAPRYWLVGSVLQASTTSGPPTLFDPGGGAYYDNTFSGPSEAFVIQMDVNGNIPWATYYGGNGEDYGFGIDIDYAENVYITGTSESTDLNSNGTFPSPNLSGGYLKTSVTGIRDHFLGCFAAGTYVPIWGTYYGGGILEETSDIAVFQTDAVYLTGAEASKATFPMFNGPGCTGAGTPYTDFVWAVPGPTGGSYTKASIAEFCLGPIFVGTPEEEQPVFGVNVFPNPTNGLVGVTCAFDTPHDVTLEVRNIVGQVVYTRKIAGAMTVQEQLDLSEYANGMYFINVQAGERSVSEKIILQR